MLRVALGQALEEGLGLGAEWNTPIGDAITIKAGSPRLTTAIASLIAGPRSLGSVMGPLPYMPYAFAIIA